VSPEFRSRSICHLSHKGRGNFSERLDTGE
jgi:hypothetical protein